MTSTSSFTRFPERLQAAIVARLGWSSLRPVQELAAQALLDGCNAIILAPTAGGKTEASMFPLLAQLMEQEPIGVGMIYIAPIKALLNNQADRMGLYCEMVGLSRFLWHGDVKAAQKKAFLRQPATVLMTTPESLEVMLMSAKIPHAQLFADLRAIVIDEVHALAGSDRGAHLMSVLERALACTPNDVQRIGLSATVGNPEQMLDWLQGTSQRSAQIISPPPAPTRKEIQIIYKDSTLEIARSASVVAQQQKSLFFCQSRALAEVIAIQMQNQGIDVFIHHSSVALEERTLAEERFQQGRNNCIVCTSTLELGIDVGDLDRVFQANAPDTVSAFLQRLGRTGRRGGAANTTFFVDHPAALLQAIALVELARQGWVEAVTLSQRNWPVLLQQVLALTMQFGAVSPADCWRQLSSVADFAGIERAEFDRFLRHLLDTDYLHITEGLLVIGTETEKVFGRKNFMALYAVFSSPQQYEVYTHTGQAIGSLEEKFVDALTPDISSFLLSGRAWVTQTIDRDQHRLEVKPAPHGQRPKWGGFLPHFLSWEICQEIAKLLHSSQEIAYLDPNAQQSLANCRSEQRQTIVEPIAWPSDQQVIWWTYAGGKINRTLKYGLEHYWGWQVSANNFQVTISGEHLTPVTLAEAIAQVIQPEFWSTAESQDFLLQHLPNYRFSKFQQALPKQYALEVVQSHLLDIPGLQKLTLLV
ncbi:MAG: DEAD/DEAH box helicase [Aphanocapsa sp. GSE-SYN-MK-11-07L]|nr:DEAD/DEAH box helicase [Aphanocapsa sp. GSE-SYN-MK-11-07L]